MTELFDNIRARYDFAAPAPELTNCVEFFAESAAGTGCPLPYAGKMFASWTPTCYVNLGPAYDLDLGLQRHHVPAGESVLLLRNQTVVRHVPLADHLFTIKFHPGGLEAVLGVSQVALADRLVPLRQVLPPALLAQLRQADSFAARTSLVQQHLQQALGRPKKTDHYLHLVREAISEYRAGELHLSTSAVAERVFLTSRTINRYFHRVVGVSPKRYFAVLRARAALAAFVASPAGFAPDDYGYYDGSHFRKAMRQFTGQPLPAGR